MYEVTSKCAFGASAHRTAKLMGGGEEVDTSRVMETIRVDLVPDFGGESKEREDLLRRKTLGGFSLALLMCVSMFARSALTA